MDGVASRRSLAEDLAVTRTTARARPLLNSNVLQRKTVIDDDDKPDDDEDEGASAASAASASQSPLFG